MAHRLQLFIAGALAFDFTDRAGINNPHGLKAWPMSDLAFGFSSGDPVFHEPRSRPGGFLVQRQERLVESRLRLKVDADDADALHFGVSELDYLLKQGGTLEWQPDGGTTRFIDFETGWTEGLLRGQDISMLYIRSGDWEGLPVVFMRQPFLRLAEIASAAVAVPNDPAAASGMIFEEEIEGDAAAPVSIKLTSQGGSIRRALVALFQGEGQADYVDTVKVFQAEAGTLGGDTSSVADANASGGNAAECSYATSTALNRRVRCQRSTLLTPLKRELAVFARIKAMAASSHELQLRSGPGLGDPTTSHDRVPLDVSTATSFVYVLKRLGTISIPDDVPVGGITLDVWSRRLSGTGALRFDYILLAPADALFTELVIPGAADDFWTGAELVTPTNPAGLTAGSVDPGQDYLKLITNNNAGGNPPTAGIVYGAAHHEVTFNLDDVIGNPGSMDATIRVRNITDSVDVVSESVPNVPGPTQRTLVFDSVVGKAYQFQVVKTADQTGLVRSISHTMIPALATGESLSTNPDQNRACKLDSAGNIAFDLESEGGIPAWIEAGPFALLIHVLDIEKPGYTDGESVLSRSPLVSISYSPRVPI